MNLTSNVLKTTLEITSEHIEKFRTKRGTGMSVKPVGVKKRKEGSRVAVK